MERSDILRLSESIKSFVNVIERAFNKNLFFAPPHPDISEIKEIINHIVNNDDKCAITAVMPLLERKDIIGEYCWNLTYAILTAPTIDPKFQEWNDKNPDSNLKFRGNDNSELYAYTDYLSTLEYELRILSSWLEAKNEKPKEDAPTQSNIFKYMRTTKKIRLKDTLHKEINGKTGREAILPLYVAVNMKLMNKPSYKVFISEFGNIISESEYSKVMNYPKFDPTEVDYMERIFSPIKQ